MTTHAAPDPGAQVTGRLFAAIGLAIGFIAGVTLSEQWRADDPQVTRVVNVGLAATEVDERFPLTPSVGPGDRPMTADEAAAQHEALIDSWLPPSV
jgi:hypothetical protein